MGEKKGKPFRWRIETMALKNTIKKMEILLAQLTVDLVKAEKGNKAAAQRVRTLSIQFAKVAKVYRKESMQNKKATAGKTSFAATGRVKKSSKRKKSTKVKRKTTTKKRC